MEEKLGRKKKYRMRTKDTEYFSFGIGDYIRRYCMLRQ